MIADDFVFITKLCAYRGFDLLKLSGVKQKSGVFK
jgi:hypothetical protein